MPPHCRPPPPFTRIIDTGTSHHNLALGDGDPQQYIEYKTNPPAVMIPNGDNITTRAHYNLGLQNVSAQASEADILPSFKHSLLSVGQLCDDDCTAIFTKTIAPYTTNTKNPSSTVSETIPRGYMNNVYPRPTLKPPARPMQRCQQKTSQNTLNTYINVPSPQPLAHGCKLSAKAISKRGPESPSRPYNATYQNLKQQPWDIWTNNEKT